MICLHCQTYPLFNRTGDFCERCLEAFEAQRRVRLREEPEDPHTPFTGALIQSLLSDDDTKIEPISGAW